MVWGFVALREEFPTAPLVEQYRILCDAFTIPGIMLLCVGAMIWVSNAGALDGLTYVFSYAIGALVPGGRKHQKFLDYVEHRRENRVKGYGFLLISGAVTLAIAGVFMILFYQVY